MVISGIKQIPGLNPSNPLAPSFPHRRESSKNKNSRSGQHELLVADFEECPNLKVDPLRGNQSIDWIPACAGMTKFRFNRRSRLNGMIWILFTLISLLAATPALAAFQASVDRNPVAEGESFTLTLKSDENLGDDPDLSPLQQDFEVLGKSSGSSMQMINGSVTRSIHWQISLMPKHSGPSVIPAIKAGGQSTQPIVIGVTKADQAKAAQQSGELFVEVIAEPHSAYVQQQIMFTVRLHRAVNIGNGSSLSDPKFPGMDAMVERIGEDRTYQTMLNGQAYAVTERRYAVYPQKSGQFNSEPVQFDGEIIETSRGGGFMFNPFVQSSRYKRVNSKSISFSIKPAPAGLGGVQWLPASQLQLTEQWSENPPKFTAGEPITRTLTISAKGLSAAQLPALDGQNIDGLKLYPDQPVLKDNKDDNGISGVRTHKIAIMPTRPGSFILPAIEVKWWNVNTDKMEVARLPPREITVLAGNTNSGSANAANTNQLPALAAGASPGAPSELTAPSPDIFSNTALAPTGLADTKYSRGWWPWLSLILGTGWLATLILWWWQARKKQPSAKTGSGNEESARVKSMAQLENQLKKSCMSNDAAQAKSKLLGWAKLRWPQNPPTSLTAMAGLCQQPLAGALNELDRALYAQNKDEWQGEKFWELFSKHKPVNEAMQEGKSDSLEPLFLASR